MRGSLTVNGPTRRHGLRSIRLAVVETAQPRPSALVRASVGRTTAARGLRPAGYQPTGGCLAAGAIATSDRAAECGAGNGGVGELTAQGKAC